jgi:PAS domain S-box-containing protein
MLGDAAADLLIPFEDFVSAGGELSRLILAYDWGATSAGPIESWPATMRGTVAMMLRSPVPIVTLWGDDGVMIYNDAYSVFAGGAHPRLLGAPVRQGWPEVAAFNDNVMRTVMNGGRLAYREQELTLLRNGEPEQVWLDLDYSAVPDAQGRALGVIAFVIDATERVRAARSVQDERERLRALFEQAPSFMSLKTGPQHRYELVNQTYLAMLGRQDVIGRTIAEVAPEVLDQPIYRLIEEAYRTGEPRHATGHPVRIARQPGAPPETRFVDVVYQPVRDATGAVTGIFSQGSDVTDRVLAERLAARGQDDFRAVTEIMPNQVWTARPDGSIDWFNARAAEYTGIAQTDVRGDAWRDLIHPDDAGGVAARWAQAVSTGAVYDVEFRLCRHDGVYRWHLARALAVCGHEGQIERWIGTNTDIHERKLAEAESTRERNRIWALSQEPMFVGDFTGRILTGNPAVTRMLGWAPEEILGRNVSDFVHPEDVARATAQIGRLAAGETVSDLEIRMLSKTGSTRIINWAAVPEDGRFHAVGRDVTDERRAAADRERSWQLSPVVKLITTLDGAITAVNPAWCRVLGWTEAETIGRNMREFVTREDRARAQDAMAMHTHGDPVKDYLVGFRTKSDGRREIAWTTTPQDGFLYAFGRDVTAERAAARALAASTAERDRIWAAANDLMGTGGFDGFLRAVNPAWERLLGYSETELMARPYIELVHEADRARTIEAIGSMMGGASVRDFEIRVMHADGESSLISWSADPAGDVFHMTGRDVTAQRLTEDALRQSQKMEAVGQLTGGIAHDFNNLLQGITGSLDLLQKRIAQGRVGELDRFIAGAMGAAGRASALTHRLLAFSRRQPLDPRPVAANALIVSMEDLLRRTMGEQVSLELGLTEDLWLTLCDPNQLENAVLNLAINARDAMPGGGRLGIRTGNAPLDAPTGRATDMRAGDYVVVSVYDTGTGMDEDTVAKAFEPFFTTKPIGQGTGLGLSMIYGFARQSEGYVKINSRVGEGTAVHLFLPRHHGTLDAHAAAAAVVAPEAAGETVLVVEDEPVVRALIVEVLADLGYAALEAADGPSGLAILQGRQRIDLLITDIGLPGLNGRQVADAGRLKRPGLKVLFMTGYAENAACASGFLEDGMAMMTKPFAMDVLAARIRRIIEDKVEG